MKNLICLVCIWINIVFFVCADNPVKNKECDIIIENEQFRLVVGSNAIAKSLTLKSTGEECLIDGENIPIFSVTQERPYHNEIKLAHPNKKTTFQADTVYWNGDKLIVGFELIPYEAIIKIKEVPAYVGFILQGFKVNPGTYPDYLKITPPPATELCLLQLPVRNKKYFGEWLNVSWDENVAVNVLATDENAYIDFEKYNNYKLLTATAFKDIKLEGTGAALIVCKPENLLDNIAQIEEDFDLPKGVQSRRSGMINASYYWSAEVNPGNVDQHIQYAKMGGFRTMNLYYPCFEGYGGYDLIGNYEIDKRLYPNGKEDLKKMLDKIKASGIIPGVHFLHSHIGRNSKYVTPIPDYRLNLTKTFTLSEDLEPGDTEVFVEQNPEGSVMAEGCRVLKVGTEFISYENYTTTRPYKFTGCTRGINHTTVNSLPKGSIIGILDVSEFGATSVYIDQRTGLQDEIAEKIADIYDAGFQFIYFDGSEGVNPPFALNVALAQYRVFKRLKPEPLFAEGAAKSHFSWHMLSGGNAFDVFTPEILKAEIRKWPAEEAPRMKQDFTRINFGWLGYFLPDKHTVGTQPDMLEYATSVAAGWDCPVSIHAYLHTFDAHPRTQDNLEVLRRWEEVRAKNWLTDEQKKMLQNVGQEHHLLLNEQNRFELVPYDPIIDVAGKSREIRAFIFERKGDHYVVYWHISGDKKLELSLNPSDITLYEKLGQEKMISSGTNHKIIIPASNRHYIKADKLTKHQLSDAFKNAQIVE
ncbi:hypothetical protein [uncultured Proteiniphilum sp.]|uniref:hypothetical protein n=1 Tax=uncultured Proteiniphilum sp. TaxID=497637 RepID=UPI00262A76F8|nr:hypothetical protein [uncultured Proteiniphilum sp.]